jgi:cytosine/adenosine deaminase-related metal-dependent hydrolase
MNSILIKNALIMTMDPTRRIIENGFLTIEGNQITDIGSMTKLSASSPEKTIDAKGKLVMPGMINVHSHVADILLRGGLSQDRSLYDWLLNVLYPGMQACTPDDIKVGTKLYLDEAIRSGITTIVDNEDFPDRENHKVMMEVFKRTGNRIVFGRMFNDLPPPPEVANYYKVIESKSPKVHHVENYLVEDTQKAFTEIEYLIKEYHTNDGLIQIWPSPSSPSWCSKEALVGCLDIAQRYDTGIAIHLAETEIEFRPFGMSTTEYLDSIQFLNPRLLAAHCVWLNERDIRLLKHKDVKIAHQPTANMYLADGFSPIPKMLAHGLTIGLGTDDANDNDSVNIIAEMKAAALVHKAKNHDASCMTADQVTEMATTQGAKALQLDKSIGSLEVGKKADIIIIDLMAPHLRPIHHLPSVLTYQAKGNDVETVITNGKVLMENRKLTWMSEEEETDLLDEAQLASDAIKERAQLESPGKPRMWS